LEKYSESSSSVVERDALRKMVLLRWSVGAVGAGSVPGDAVGGARFGLERVHPVPYMELYFAGSLVQSTVFSYWI
jgi:hypothetical protein